ncbi:MAG: diaminopimelate epimerase [Bacteriovorax sp.]|nr:diaminopimelate epimerase [Bacteriovorax sp.]
MINFTKMNATGNDFVVIDNRDQLVNAGDVELWKKLCSLKTGIGADGILLLEKSTKADFKMRYINADGGEVEMCGNGGRAITAFAHEIIKPIKNIYHFETMNGLYECSIDSAYGFRLKMTELYDVDKINLDSLKIPNKNSMYLNTGVPHSVFEVENVQKYPVFENGKNIRYSPLFEKGCNANFYEVVNSKHLRVRTYERGVENETLSCGTGVTATAIAAAKKYNWKDEIVLETLGGTLAVKFNADFSEVFLCGKVEKIFIGSV